MVGAVAAGVAPVMCRWIVPADLAAPIQRDDEAAAPVGPQI